MLGVGRAVRGIVAGVNDGIPQAQRHAFVRGDDQQVMGKKAPPLGTGERTAALEFFMRGIVALAGILHQQDPAVAALADALDDGGAVGREYFDGVRFGIVEETAGGLDFRAPVAGGAHTALRMLPLAGQQTAQALVQPLVPQLYVAKFLLDPIVHATGASAKAARKSRLSGYTQTLFTGCAAAWLRLLRPRPRV